MGATKSIDAIKKGPTRQDRTIPFVPHFMPTFDVGQNKMNPPISLNQNIYLIRNSFSASKLKTSDSYDIYADEGQTPQLTCKEQSLSKGTKIRRMIGGDVDRAADFEWRISEEKSDDRFYTLERKTHFTKGVKMRILNTEGDEIGEVKKVFFTIGTKFKFEGKTKESTFVIKIKNKLNGYKLVIDGRKIGEVQMRWKKAYSKEFKERFSHSIELSEDFMDQSFQRFIVFSIGLSIHKLIN